MRRYYPFFPMLPAISLKEVEVDGYRIPEGSWVILDLYGTDHDERTVEAPDSFMIKRYVGKQRYFYKEEYEMIAQGGEIFDKCIAVQENGSLFIVYVCFPIS